MKRLVPLLALAVCAAPASAERPIEPGKFVYNANSGYIFACVAPMNGKQSFKQWLEFVRVDPATGKSTVQDRGGLRSTNARRVKDAAAIYYEAKPWTFDADRDRACFLTAITPGFWVVGSVGNTALSMGSYGFDVAPGKITHVGTILVGAEDGTSTIPEIAGAKISDDLLDYGTFSKQLISWTIVWRPPVQDDLPENLSTYPAVLATAPQRDVRFDNYISALVGRAADLGPMVQEKPVPKAESYEAYLN